MVGVTEGAMLGYLVGKPEGVTVGRVVGDSEGPRVGVIVGAGVGCIINHICYQTMIGMINTDRHHIYTARLSCVCFDLPPLWVAGREGLSALRRGPASHSTDRACQATTILLWPYLQNDASQLHNTHHRPHCCLDCLTWLGS